ncbi:DNA alkylation repair protein [Flavivirga spongiicola]|uniref:DNA alkylation repair protein n=1 Tax=Flavivirga spongiicola TaxID=421621 RepID=A0ABU7XP33_9FLAO|nr:DNA alkylation repair protein [Flavivirga sp. MEBiC05379]MDO5977325.1 DNA alkylation repair protein [Flavivirga sp. MEBiC05379]
MNIVTRKSEIKIYLSNCIQAYHQKGITACLAELSNQILNRKVKFPLLEFCAHELSREIKENEQILLCDKIEALKTEGGNVILGIILQNRLEDHFEESLDKTTEYTSKADIWYVCDIIGERTYGYALRHYPKKTIPVMTKLSNHPKKWVIRSLGAGVHNAVRKGLDKQHVATVFLILISMANTQEKEIRQGVGWAAKTTARFHPDVIEQYHAEIHNQEKVANWFRRKIIIGLERHNYDKRNSG